MPIPTAINNQPLLSFSELSARGTASLGSHTDSSIGTSNAVAKTATNAAKASKPYNLASIYKAVKSWFGSLWRQSLSTQLPLETQRPLLLNSANGQLLAGQLTVLTGASGSGKSVLLRLLAGLTSISTGDIDLNGISIFDSSPIYWRAQVALLSQHPQLIEGSVLDNLQLPYTLDAHHNQQFDKQWHLKQLSYLQRNEQLLYQSTAYLSGGERQLVNILRLLQLDPQVLLLDEPTAALDPQTAADLIRLLLKWLHDDSNRALLWITHDIDSIMPFADSHWQMQAGQLTKLA